MAQQQHRQACLAHWPGHHSKQGEGVGTHRVLIEEQGKRPWRRHDGTATVVAARPPSRGCDSKGAASCSWPSGRAQHGGDVGVADCHPTDAATESHRKHRGARAETPARLTRVDQAARARSTGRSSAAIATIGGEDDETPRSGGSVRRGEADMPLGGGGSRRSRARSSSAIPNRQRGLVLGTDREGEQERGSAGWAEPVWSSPLGLTDRWAQAVRPAFYLI
jgi:hypothetical protein